MSSQPNTVPEQEIHYFGKVSASVSHELKNVLAILNEHAGLLQDFAAMAEQGQQLSHEKIKRVADNMLAQIKRGDNIIKRMNQFAHTADAIRSTVNLYNLLTLVVEMFERTASTRGVKVTAKTTETDLNIHTNEFALETLLGTLLDRLTFHKPVLTELNIAVNSTQNEVQIIFSGLGNHSDIMAQIIQANDIKYLCAMLNTCICLNENDNDFVITFPINIDT